MATPVMRADVGSNVFAWSKLLGKEKVGSPWGISPTWNILRLLQLLQILNHYASQQRNYSDLTREMEGGWNTFAMVVPRTIPVSGAAARKNWSSFFAFPCHKTPWPYNHTLIMETTVSLEKRTRLIPHASSLEGLLEWEIPSRKVAIETTKKKIHLYKVQVE